MIIAEFYYTHDKKLSGFRVSGHASFDDYGKDIVCAAVSSAVQLTVNGLTECAGLQADVSVKENSVDFRINSSAYSCEAMMKVNEIFLQSLKLHLNVLSQDYANTIKIIN